MGAVTQYVESNPVREERERYFLDNGFGAGGNYDEEWVHIKLGPIPIAFPNSDARRRAVRYHDLHHILTGYSTELIGEFEISAWEVSSGCGRLWFAWGINMQGFVAGMFLSPSAIYQAFLRGRRTRNLYHREFGDALLDTPLGDLRRQLGFDTETRGELTARSGERLAFGFWLGLSALWSLLFGLLLVAPLAALAWGVWAAVT